MTFLKLKSSFLSKRHFVVFSTLIIFDPELGSRSLNSLCGDGDGDGDRDGDRDGDDGT